MQEIATSHARSRSADYLLDRQLVCTNSDDILLLAFYRARDNAAPPENNLQKLLGSQDSNRVLSENELRFQKSLEKLHVPDWYLNSDYCPGGKYSPNTTYQSNIPVTPQRNAKQTSSVNYQRQQ